MSIHPHAVCALKHAVTCDRAQNRYTQLSQCFCNIAFFPSASCHPWSCQDSAFRCHEHQVAAENCIGSVFSLIFYIMYFDAKVCVDLYYIVMLFSHQLHIDGFIRKSNCRSIKIFYFFAGSSHQYCPQGVDFGTNAEITPVFVHIVFKSSFFWKPSFTRYSINILFYLAHIAFTSIFIYQFI